MDKLIKWIKAKIATCKTIEMNVDDDMYLQKFGYRKALEHVLNKIESLKKEEAEELLKRSVLEEDKTYKPTWQELIDS